MPPDPAAHPHPAVARDNARTEADRRAWAAYLFDRGMEHHEYPSVFWGDVKSRPFMRALYGQGICLWRLGQAEAARQIFSRMMELNPRDNQGVRLLLPDLEEGLSWEESVERQQRRSKKSSGVR